MLPILTLAVAWLAFFWRYLLPAGGQAGILAVGDFTHQFYAYRLFTVGWLREGILPLWNPHIYLGHPFAGDVQSGLYYPPALLLDGVGALLPRYPLYLTELESLAHILLAAIGTYAFLRRLGRSGVAALLGAFTFGFGGFVTGYPPLQVPVVESIAWLPLFLLGLDETLREPSRKRGVPLAGGALGLSMLAGHYQMVAYLGLLGLAYAAFLIGLRPSPCGRVLLRLTAVLVGGTLLGAANLVPGLEFIGYSDRVGASYTELSGGFPWSDLRQLVVPDWLTLWSPMYVGLLPLFLSGVALVRGRRRARLFWSGVALFSLLLSTGRNGPLYPLFYHLVPGFQLFRSQERAIVAFSFALAVLAAHGLDLLRQSWSRDRGRSLHIGLLAGGAVALGAAAAVLPMEPVGFPAAAQRSAAVLGLAAVWRALPDRRAGAVWLPGAAVLALVLGDLYTSHALVNFQPGSPFQFQLATQVQPTLNDEDPALYRVDQPLDDSISYGMAGGIDLVQGVGSMKLAAWRDFVEMLPELRHWDLSSARYVINDREGIGQGAETVDSYLSKDGIQLYVHQLRFPWPRAFLVPEFRVVPDRATALRLLASQETDIDPKREALLQKPPAAPLRGTRALGFDAPTVRATRPDPNHLIIHLDEPHDGGWLVVLEPYYPGWRAKGGGKGLPVHPANGPFMALPLEPGIERVTLTFLPSSVLVGVGLSVLGLALLVLSPRLLRAIETEREARRR